MCFSASASLTASAFLLGVGGVTTRLARTPGERAYAAIPLLFAVQQLTEGIVWLSFGWNTPHITGAATQLYSFFSHVLWPVYVPIAAWLMERDMRRRRLLAAICLVGMGVGAYLLYSMIADPIRAEPTGGHIEYVSPHFYATLSMSLYLIATTASLMLSTHRWVQLFGALAFASAIGAYALFARWFISVWCLFAALMSVAVAFHLCSRQAAARFDGVSGNAKYR